MWIVQGAAVLAALFLLALPGRLSAQDVALTSRDGSIEVEGTLLGYDGEFYRVDTVYGALTLDSQGVVCEGPGCPDLAAYVANVRISGARTMGAVLLPALVEAFAASRDLKLRRIVTDDDHFRFDLLERVEERLVAQFHFRVSSSDEGFADLLAEEADLAMALREVTEAEVARAKDAALGDMGAPQRARIVALDGLVPVVGRGNAMRAITLADLQRVLAGEITSWEDLGGAPGDIALHVVERRTGLGQSVRVQLGADIGPAATQHETASDLADAVARDANAIGVTSYSEIGNAWPLRLVGPCGREIAASTLTLKAEDYPLATPLFLYTPARRLPLFAREFLTWLSSPPAQLVIRRAGFVNQSPERIALADQGERLAYAVEQVGAETPLADLQALLRSLDGADRLTTTFRFRAGSTRLDAQSEGNVRLLARAVEAGIYDGQTLLFVGFSDGQGPAEGNKRISRERAQAAAQAVRERAKTADWSRVKVQVLGYGETLPIGCDGVDWGQQMNRRVEVWVR